MLKIYFINTFIFYFYALNRIFINTYFFFRG